MRKSGDVHGQDHAVIGGLGDLLGWMKTSLVDQVRHRWCEFNLHPMTLTAPGAQTTPCELSGIKRGIGLERLVHEFDGTHAIHQKRPDCVAQSTPADQIQTSICIPQYIRIDVAFGLGPLGTPVLNANPMLSVNRLLDGPHDIAVRVVAGPHKRRDQMFLYLFCVFSALGTQKRRDLVAQRPERLNHLGRAHRGQEFFTEQQREQLCGLHGDRIAALLHVANRPPTIVLAQWKTSRFEIPEIAKDRALGDASFKSLMQLARSQSETSVLEQPQDAPLTDDLIASCHGTGKLTGTPEHNRNRLSYFSDTFSPTGQKSVQDEGVQ